MMARIRISRADRALLAVLAATWAGCGVGITCGISAPARAIPVLATLLGIFGTAFGLSRSRAGAVRSGALLFGITLSVIALVAAVCGAARAVPLMSADLPWATASAQFDVVLTDDPHAASTASSRAGSSGDAWIANVTILAWSTSSDGVHPVDLPARLRVTSDIHAVLPGTGLVLRGRVLPGDPWRRTAATLIGEDIRVAAPAPAGQNVAGALRTALVAACQGLPPDARGLLPGLTLGDTSGVSVDLTAAMRDAGLAHLTAVSGGNVALMLALVMGLGRRYGLKRRGLTALGLAVLPAYVILVRPQPSVLRAAVMAAIVLVALAFGRRARPVAVLSLGCSLLLMADPYLAMSIGFAMSVSATGGLVAVALCRRPPIVGTAKWLVTVKGAALASAAASLAVAPLVAGIGGGVPLLSVPANVIAMAAVAPAGVLGLLAAFVAVIAPLPASWIAWVAGWAAGLIAWVARTTSNLPGAVLPWPSGLLGAGAMCTVIVLVGAGLFACWRLGQLRIAAALSSVLLAVVVLLPAAGIAVPGASWPPPGWVMVACDVGQGDALVLSAGAGVAVVVDAGPDPVAVDRCLRRLGIHSIPIVVLTHAHADHVEGLPGVLHGRSVGQVVVTPLAEPAAEARRVASWSAAANIPVVNGTAGEARRVGAVTWTVLWPDRILRGTDSDPNNASIVMLVEVRGVRLLLGGDLQPEAQSHVLAERPPGSVDVVKIPHHGSPKQDPAWASRASPRLAIVSVGVNNDYGHPSPATLRQYTGLGTTLGRTDQDGDVAVVLGVDGQLVLVARGR